MSAWGLGGWFRRGGLAAARLASSFRTESTWLGAPTKLVSSTSRVLVPCTMPRARLAFPICSIFFVDWMHNTQGCCYGSGGGGGLSDSAMRISRDRVHHSVRSLSMHSAGTLDFIPIITLGNRPILTRRSLRTLGWRLFVLTRLTCYRTRHGFVFPFGWYSEFGALASGQSSIDGLGKEKRKGG